MVDKDSEGRSGITHLVTPLPLLFQSQIPSSQGQSTKVLPLHLRPLQHSYFLEVDTCLDYVLIPFGTFNRSF